MKESVSKQFKKELDINYDITFDEALARFPTLTRSNFDYLKYEYRKKQKKSAPKNPKKKSKKKSPGENKILTSKEILALTPATVEKLIIDKLNNKSAIPDSVIRMALDHIIKLKIKSGDGMEKLDMEGFLKLGEGNDKI